MVSETYVIPPLTHEQANNMVGHKRGWRESNGAPHLDGGRYDAKAIVQWLLERQAADYEARLLIAQQEATEDKKRRIRADADKAEAQARLEQLKLSQKEGDLIPVENVNRIFEIVGAELRQPIEIIGQNHPELQGLLTVAWDKAMTHLEELFADKPVS